MSKRKAYTVIKVSLTTGVQTPYASYTTFQKAMTKKNVLSRFEKGKNRYFVKNNLIEKGSRIF
jgi:hypothetical protein